MHRVCVCVEGNGNWRRHHMQTTTANVQDALRCLYIDCKQLWCQMIRQSEILSIIDYMTKPKMSFELDKFLWFNTQSQAAALETSYFLTIVKMRLKLSILWKHYWIIKWLNWLKHHRRCQLRRRISSFRSHREWERQKRPERVKTNEQITRCWTRLIASNKNRNESKCVSFRFVSSSMCYLDDQLNVTS